MNRRLLGLLIALHPPRWRRRYGEELRTLTGELAARGDRSTTGLASSLLLSAGREWVRAAGTRRSAAGLATLAAIAIALALITPGSTVPARLASTRQPATGAHLRHAPTILTPALGGSCFVAGTTCGGPPCQEFVAAQGTARAECIRYPSVRPHVVLVSARPET